MTDRGPYRIIVVGKQTVLCVTFRGTRRLCYRSWRVAHQASLQISGWDQVGYTIL